MAGGAANCSTLLVSIFGDDFDAADAAHFAAWTGQPCPFVGPPPADPACANGLRGKMDGLVVCCSASCGVCEANKGPTPGECGNRGPGGQEDCCPHAILQQNAPCAKRGAPCVIGPAEAAVDL